MHRSSSYYLSSSSSSSLASAAVPSGTAAAGMDVDQLPTYDPQSDAAKKEALDASRANLAHALVHLVPVVVLLCCLLLWSFSTTIPSPSEVGVIVEKKGRLIMPLKSGSASGWNGSGMMTRTEDLDPTNKEAHGSKVGKKIKNEGLKK